jgi:hypothetical protein
MYCDKNGWTIIAQTSTMINVCFKIQLNGLGGFAHLPYFITLFPTPCITDMCWSMWQMYNFLVQRGKCAKKKAS